MLTATARQAETKSTHGPRGRAHPPTPTEPPYGAVLDPAPEDPDEAVEEAEEEGEDFVPEPERAPVPADGEDLSVPLSDPFSESLSDSFLAPEPDTPPSAPPGSFAAAST